MAKINLKKLYFDRPTYDHIYVCIEVALCGDANGIRRSNLAKERDPSGSRVQYPNPAEPTLDHTCALNVRFLIQLYFRQLKVSCYLI